MRTTLPGTAPPRPWQHSSGTQLSLNSKVAQALSIDLSGNAVRDAGPLGKTPAIIATPASLQRINLLFFLRSITESPRHK
jgi:hypothetical protein